MSDSVRPQRQQPTRLPCPWDSPGKNTGVGCHFLLQVMKVKSESEGAQSCPTLHDPMDCSLPGSSAHGIFEARVLEWIAIAFSPNNVRSLLFSLSPSLGLFTYFSGGWTGLHGFELAIRVRKTLSYPVLWVELCPPIFLSLVPMNLLIWK